MGPQSELFGLPESSPLQYSIFLAIFPDPTTAQHLIERAAFLRNAHGFTGRFRPIHHLHVTLHHLFRNPRVSSRLALVVGQICAPIAARTPSFEVTFDRALSFQGKRPDRPLVLCGATAANERLRDLHRMLAEGLTSGSAPRNGQFAPHVTLLYDRRFLREEPIEPVSWQVREVVLVSSLAGATRYERLASWPLRNAGL